MEKDKDGNVRERYIGPLDTIVEIELGVFRDVLP
ncbi:MAG: putative integrase [Acidianus sp.]